MGLFKRNKSCCICGTEYYKPLFIKWMFKRKKYWICSACSQKIERINESELLSAVNIDGIKEIVAEHSQREKERISALKIKKSIKPKGIPSGKFLKQMTISPVGITFDCKKEDGTSRQDILSQVKEGDVVKLEKYKYKRKDAYMLIDQRTGLDFGVIYSELAEDISKNYSNNKIEGYISKRGNFYSDNEKYEDEFGLIETCRVKLYILE